MTVAVGGIQFVAADPDRRLVTCASKLIHTGTSSMHFAVDVLARDLQQGRAAAGNQLRDGLRGAGQARRQAHAGAAAGSRETRKIGGWRTTRERLMELSKAMEGRWALRGRSWPRPGPVGGRYADDGRLRHCNTRAPPLIVAKVNGRGSRDNTRSLLEGYPSGQRGQTVNLLAYAFGGSNPPPSTSFNRASFSTI